MEYGADPNVPSYRGNYPVAKCMYRGHIEIVDLLLKYKSIYSILSFNMLYLGVILDNVNHLGLSALEMTCSYD
jgi:ankyrin repeat protein